MCEEKQAKCFRLQRINLFLSLKIKFVVGKKKLLLKMNHNKHTDPENILIEDKGDTF